MCDTIEDCAGDTAKFCYKNVPWNPDPSVCDCHNYYGFVGENCDQVTVQVVYLRTILVLQLLWAALLSCLLSVELVRYLKHCRKSISKLADLDPVFYAS